MIRFKTLEELQDKYPVGSIFFENYQDARDYRFFFSKKDFQLLQKEYDTIEAIDDITCECKKSVHIVQIVEGYIYDGEYWYPAYDSLEGWRPYDEYDLMQE